MTVNIIKGCGIALTNQKDCGDIGGDGCYICDTCLKEAFKFIT